LSAGHSQAARAELPELDGRQLDVHEADGRCDGRDRQDGKSGEALHSPPPPSLWLAQEYGVSHRTSGRALRTLADEGLIVALHGKGFYVVKKSSGR
jgi:hypothetical protein